jgi:hypothetical protein
LQNSSQEYKCRVDQHCIELQFEVGDQVLAHLKKEIFPRGTYNKLKMNNIGSCNTLRKFDANFYDIEFPIDVGYHPYSTYQTSILTGEMKQEKQKIRKIFNGKSKFI